MGKVLIITGDLATGKSTFSSILSKRYGINVFTKDTIKEVLGDNIGFSNREENLKLSKAAIELMYLIFSEFAKLDNNIILESNFHEYEMKKLIEIAKKNNYAVRTLVLRGDIDILHERYLNRMTKQNRHPVHLSAPLDNFDNFKNYIENARKEKAVGDTLYIDTNNFSYQSDENLLLKIDEFMK